MNVKKIAISQSNYLPWKGYFDVIAQVDEFVLYDEVQYTRRDWRNRNRIKTSTGLRWITVPVESKGRFTQRIDETLVGERNWGAAHWNALEHAYARAPHFREMAPRFERFLLSETPDHLSLVNYHLLRVVMDMLGIATTLSWSTEYGHNAEHAGRTARLVSICAQAKATDYYSGPAARAYLDEDEFARAGVRVHFIDHAGYPEYPQLHGPFEHKVSVVDLVFNTGPDAHQYLKATRRDV